MDRDFNLNSAYAVATTSYLANGKDGYETFPDCPYIIDPDVCPVLEDILERFFHYPKAYQYIDEYNVFFSQKEFITREVIKAQIDYKLNQTKGILDFIDNLEIEDADGDLESDEFSVFEKQPTLTRSSISFNELTLNRGDSKKMVHVLNRHNAMEVLEEEMGITVECMTR